MSADPFRFDAHAHALGSRSLSDALEAEAKAGTIDTGVCEHCGGPIYLAPYFLDGKLPNPPVWQHSDHPGRTCRNKPKGWRKQSWPIATPTSSDSRT